MMSFEEFVEYAKEHIKDQLPENFADADVSIQEIAKTNDLHLTGLMIQEKGNSIAPNIYLEEYYDNYRKGEDINAVMGHIADARLEYGKNTLGIDIKNLTDFSFVKDKIVPVVVNAGMNADYLAEKPHTDIEDLSVIYKVDLGDAGYGRMSMPITDKMLENYGISLEEMHELAVQNISKEVEYMPLMEMINNMMGGMGVPEEDLAMTPDNPMSQVYVLSVKSRINGAAAILDKDTLDEIAAKFGDNLVIVPSSVHEALLMPEKQVTPELNWIIREVNETQVAPNEVLSDHMYLYDAQSRTITMDHGQENGLIGQIKEAVKSAAKDSKEIVVCFTMDDESYHVKAEDFLKGLERAESPEDIFTVSTGTDRFGRQYSAKFTANDINEIMLKRNNTVIYQSQEAERARAPELTVAGLDR